MKNTLRAVTFAALLLAGTFGLRNMVVTAATHNGVSPVAVLANGGTDPIPTGE